jgi:hypothetical protein
MGNLFSKSKSANKVAPVDTRLINSAPATLGQLEGTLPANNNLQNRLSEPGDSTSTKDNNTTCDNELHSRNMKGPKASEVRKSM